MTQQAALFDLDGTLVESGPGIIANIRHAMHSVGHPLPDETPLNWVIGPPLRDIFARLLDPHGLHLVEQAADTYRATYDTIGLLQTVLYPRVEAMLEAFARDGWKLLVATSKPARVARRILTNLGQADRFTAIYGSVEDGALAHKPELIGYVIDTQGLMPGRALMIGDRSFDIAGAHANGLRGIGALWGYGGRVELELAGADALADEPDAVLAQARRLLHAG